MATLILKEVSFFALRFVLCFIICAFGIKAANQFTYGSDKPKQYSVHMRERIPVTTVGMTDR